MVRNAGYIECEPKKLGATFVLRNEPANVASGPTQAVLRFDDLQSVRDAILVTAPRPGEFLTGEFEARLGLVSGI